ncbi:MAG: helicase [Thermoguttaceae bacterium]|nr:helicase [Thermoguttaceae bacterium]
MTRQGATFTFRDVLGDGGLIARRRGDYERRAEQLEMAAEVDAALRERRHLTVEAGTGVGKSFAYLVPAILFAVEDQVRDYRPDEAFPWGPDEAPSGEGASPDSPKKTGEKAALQGLSERIEAAKAAASEILQPQNVADASKSRSAFGVLEGGAESTAETRRVVVSTHTIGLQEQLFEKDAPFLSSILPFEFSVALVKGRSNYLCRRRFASAAKSAAGGTLFETEEQKEFERLKKWLETTLDGSLSDLSPAPKPEVWNEICCEQGNCLGRKCPFFERCFYAKARRRLDSAKILIVNHALLFSDLAIRNIGGSILPRYDAVVFDEAHTMEQVAAEHLGVELSQYQIDYLLNRLYNDRANRGLLVEEMARVPFGADKETFERAARWVDDCRFRAEEFFASLADWLEARPGSSGRVFERRIVKNGLSEGLARLRDALRNASDSLEDPARRQEYVAARTRVETFLSALENWLGQGEDGFVYWLEKSRFRGRLKIVMKAAPIDVAPILRKTLFNVVPTVVAASATLTTATPKSRKKGNKSGTDGGGLDAATAEETRRAFAFFRSRVGLSDARARALGSPFDYRRQMTLVLARGLELDDAAARRRGIGDGERASFDERRFYAALREYIAETDGGAFVLFTSNERMRRATEALFPWFAENEYPFFSQSEGLPRQKMVRAFKETNRGVLFGVDSFWQGVDVPGAALRNVIITKFPFLAPEQPLVEARLEAIEARGGSSFRDYLLPTAILKFKQGVGRLIRTKSDVGQVVVLDSRVHTKSYGREFLRALPDCKIRIDDFS